MLSGEPWLVKYLQIPGSFEQLNPQLQTSRSKPETGRRLPRRRSPIPVQAVLADLFQARSGNERCQWKLEGACQQPLATQVAPFLDPVYPTALPYLKGKERGIGPNAAT